MSNRLAFARRLLVALGLLFTAGMVHAAEGRLFRFADIHDDKIAFVYAGDIWLVPSEGGAARRLTTHDGMELFPKFSPDGSQIAFSAEYGGNRQVYVMSVDGGAPKQLTYYNDVGAMPPRGGFDYRVLDWTPDGKHVLFRANRLPWGVRMGRPYLVPVEGGMERPLQVPESGGGMLSPDGKKLVYTPIDREFRTWKRHRGGRAQDVWIYDLAENEAQQITTDEGTDNQPVWVGDSIYFTSDRENRLNLYAYGVESGELEKVTQHEDFDVLWPSAGPRSIVYENGGELYVFDPESRRTRRVPIDVTGDFRHTLPRTVDASRYVTGASISPSGKRVVFTARGELFSVPKKNGEARNLSHSPGVREMNAAWSPDGRHVAYLSDRSGEYEIWIRAQDGSGEERRVTDAEAVWKFPPVFSRDGERLLFGDRDQRLRWVDVESGEIRDIDRSPYNDITDYTWSGDGRYVAYSKQDESQMSSVWVADVEAGTTERLTGPMTNDYGPAFDPQGRYLYFLSDRDWNLTFSGYEFNYLYTSPTRVYAGLLQDDAPPLMLPKSDEEPVAADEDDEEESEDEDSDDDAEESFEIDHEGFESRVVSLVGSAGSYRALSATEDRVLWISGQGGGSKLEAFKLGDETTETLMEGLGGYEVSADGKSFLFAAGGKYGIAALAPGQKASDGHLDLSGMKLRIEPKVEWRQIYDDALRIVRDWFYDPGLHGVGWNELHELYAPLVDHVAHRGDLDYILGELGGELNAGHFYVNWGDMPTVERVENGLLGAEIVADDGVFRVDEIFPGENWDPTFRSPLTMPGIDVSEGDYILSVDGVPTAGVANFYSLLQGKSGRDVTLLVNDGPEADGARSVTVVPISRETNLRYLKWVGERRALVDELSNGRLGYVHLPNTAVEGNRELRKGFYPQSHKEGFVFDVRYNGGGFIPDRMIELLTRTRLSFWKRRGTEPSATPGFAHVGPKVCLINAYSSSGGDAFPYYFRKLGLGPLVGKRTWGGLIGISGNPSFVDGGSLNVPTFRFLGTDGEWEVENVGVSPDVDILDRPDLVAKGEDPTLERAVEMLLEELETSPVSEIEVPPAPDYDP